MIVPLPHELLICHWLQELSWLLATKIVLGPSFQFQEGDTEQPGLVCGAIVLTNLHPPFLPSSLFLVPSLPYILKCSGYLIFVLVRKKLLPVTSTQLMGLVLVEICSVHMDDCLLPVILRSINFMANT